MKDMEKFVSKLNLKDKRKVLEIMEQIKKGNLANLNIKKLRGKDKIYRVRKMQFRFICEMDNNHSLQVIDVSRKDDTTYNF